MFLHGHIDIIHVTRARPDTLTVNELTDLPEDEGQDGTCVQRS